MNRTNWRCGWDVAVALPVALGLGIASCNAAPPIEPDMRPLFDHEACDLECPPHDDGGGGGGGGSGGGAYDTSYDYGSYSHTYDGVTMSSTDADVNSNQNAAFAEDSTAFQESSRDWDNPDAEAVVNWPLAVRATTYAVRAGRALARTTRIRQAVSSGARWARDVTVGVAAVLLAGGWPRPESDTPSEDLLFMFDYASR